MELKDTVEGMLSADYKARCKAEQDQLEIRLGKLRAMLEKYDAGTLSFALSCPVELLRVQEETMAGYLTILKWRNAIEG